MKLGNLILGWSLVAMLLPTAVRANDITVVVSNDEPIQRQELAEVNIHATSTTAWASVMGSL